MKVIYDGIGDKLPIKMWIDDIEEGAMKQAANLSRLPFAFKHIAIMPDCHQGYGMPIGGVLATKDYIIPNAVGVDIGCGMRTVKTCIQNMPDGMLKRIMQKVRDIIPVGFNRNKEDNRKAMPPAVGDLPVVSQEYIKAMKQIGTLGGGNHFIEFQRGFDGCIWIMIHSGSRNLGYKVAQYYNNRAKVMNKYWQSSVPKEWDLAFLPVDSFDGKRYISEMNYCIEFAKANREVMMSKIKEILISECGEVDFEKELDVAHNYVRLESHFGQNVWVHRKGATSAKLGELGIIPGSMGSSSFIVEGLGNKESFCSCSHGAGRNLSRTKARETLNLKEEIKRLDKQGIIHGIRNKGNLDEASGAYKDINKVMENQNDLIKIVEKLQPIASIKG